MRLRALAFFAVTFSLCLPLTAGWLDGLVRIAARNAGSAAKLAGSGADDAARYWLPRMGRQGLTLSDDLATTLTTSAARTRIGTGALSNTLGGASDDLLSYSVRPLGGGFKPMTGTGLQSLGNNGTRGLFNLNPETRFFSKALQEGVTSSVSATEQLAKTKVPDGVAVLQSVNGKWYYRAEGSKTYQLLRDQLEVHELVSGISARGPPGVLHIPKSSFTEFSKLNYLATPKASLRVVDDAGKAWSAPFIRTEAGLAPSLQIAPRLHVKPDAVVEWLKHQDAVTKTPFSASKTRIIAAFDAKANPATIESLSAGAQNFKSLTFGPQTLTDDFIKAGEQVILIGHREGEFLVMHNSAGAVVGKISIENVVKTAAERNASVMILACRAGNLRTAAGPLEDIVSTKLGPLLKAAAAEKTQYGMLQALASGEYRFSVGMEFFQMGRSMFPKPVFANSALSRFLTRNGPGRTEANELVQVFFVASAPTIGAVYKWDK